MRSPSVASLFLVSNFIVETASLLPSSFLRLLFFTTFEFVFNVPLQCHLGFTYQVHLTTCLSDYVCFRGGGVAPSEKNTELTQEQLKSLPWFMVLECSPLRSSLITFNVSFGLTSIYLSGLVQVHMACHTGSENRIFGILSGKETQNALCLKLSSISLRLVVR